MVYRIASDNGNRAETINELIYIAKCDLSSEKSKKVIMADAKGAIANEAQKSVFFNMLEDTSLTNKINPIKITKINPTEINNGNINDCDVINSKGLNIAKTIAE